ncbi:(d)CMP kinase [Miltoncostaea marina]|uniref:(d)CMP kinase n=1 Tax=Miltoncostaea marina TaxID=2843215 RepID=UPI001C3C870D|nr:(d)CMP kinase [Miltoncostaea marina]
MIVAIDGPAGAGKSTVAREVARRLGVAYLDTGAMYRAVTWLALRDGVPVGDGEALAALARDNPIEIEPTEEGDRVRIAGRDVTADIRMPEVAAEVSEVSAHPGVREQVVAAQRALLASGSWVSDGRDVGSVVCPHADLKVFLTASLEERARRRRADLRARGVEMDAERVLEDVRRRDRLDSTRAVSPLRVARGAVVVDSSEMDAAEVADLVVRLVEDVRAASGAP